MKNEELISNILDNSGEDKYEEEWEVVMNTKGKYTLNKAQAWGLRQAIATGERGIVMFQSFAISIPYIAEFYRVRRFLKDTFRLPAQATEEPYVPISKEKWEILKKSLYEKIGKKI